MGVFVHLGRTGKLRADFLGDDIERINRKSVRILIKGIVIGRVWLARGEKVQELLTVHGEPAVGREFTLINAKHRKHEPKHFKLKDPKRFKKTCQFHNVPLDKNGKCTVVTK